MTLAIDKERIGKRAKALHGEVMNAITIVDGRRWHKLATLVAVATTFSGECAIEESGFSLY